MVKLLKITKDTSKVSVKKRLMSPHPTWLQDQSEEERQKHQASNDVLTLR